MVEIKARGAAKAEFTTVNEHFAATNNAEFGLFQQNQISIEAVNTNHAGPARVIKSSWPACFT